VSILTKKKKAFIAIAEGLLEYETLTGDEIQAHYPRREALHAISATTRRQAVERRCRLLVAKKGGAGKKGDEPDAGHRAAAAVRAASGCKP
jgi:cell division protease FtsH